MRDHDHGAAFFGHGAHHPQHLAHQFGVERRGGFIEQHHLGLHGQGAGDRDALLLAPRQVGREGIAAMEHPDLLQVALGALHRFGA